MSRSVRMDYERYRNPIIMYPCYECATCTTNPPVDGVSLCDRHTPEPMLFCDEVNTEFRTAP